MKIMVGAIVLLTVAVAGLAYVVFTRDDGQVNSRIVIREVVATPSSAQPTGSSNSRTPRDTGLINEIKRDLEADARRKCLSSGGDWDYFSKTCGPSYFEQRKQERDRLFKEQSNCQLRGGRWDLLYETCKERK